MIIDNFYAFDIRFNGISLISQEKLISFSLRESIYQICNSGILTVKDLTSLVHESLLFNEGTVLEIEYGIINHASNKCRYVVTKESLEKVDRIGNLIGDIDVEVKNEWYAKQGIKSAAYKNRIDSIVRDIVVKHPFSSLDINGTGNDDIHYQPLISDMEFIEKRLTPIAYSNNAEGSSFYSYITGDDVFHFRNGQSLCNDNPAGEYVYRKESFDHKDNINLFSMVLGLKRWKEDIKEYRRTFNYGIYRMDRDSGYLIEEKGNIYDHYVSNNGKVPVMWENESMQSYLDFNYTQTINGNMQTGRLENQIGHRNYLSRGSSFIDRFLLMVPFNPRLHAGNMVDLVIYTALTNEDVPSNYYSGRYLIEDLEHIWNGNDKKGYTKMMIGRKYANVNEEKYINAKKFVREA